MVIVAIPCLLIVPYTIIGTLSFDPYAVILLIIGVTAVLLSVYYFKYSGYIKGFDTYKFYGINRKLFWVLSIFSHLGILYILHLFVTKIGVIPFHPISVFLGYISYIWPVPFAMAALSAIILLMEIHTSRKLTNEQSNKPINADRKTSAV